MATNSLGVAFLGGWCPQELGLQCSDFRHQALLPWELSGPVHCPAIQLPIPGILQARTLEWVAISFSNA